MDEPITVKIKPHVKKFVLGEFGGEPVACKQNNLAGRLLLSMLYKKSERQFTQPGLVDIELDLSMDLAVHRKRIIDQANSGKLYEDYFKISLWYFVSGAAPFLGSRKTAIYVFCERYGIDEEEFKYETAERMFHSRSNSYSFPRKEYKNDVVNTLVQKIRVLKSANHELAQTLQKVAAHL